MPDFLIIGAQKAGTSTMYQDLLTNPRVFFPVDKEPHNLADPDVLTPRGRDKYAHLFDGAGEEQVCGEASTGYTKRPDIDGVAGRALELLGPTAKLIYIVREPVSRLVSQHHHMVSENEAPADFDQAFREIPSLVHYSRYAMQLEPWRAAFGRDAIQVIRFEQFVRDRQATTAAVCGHLGIEPMPQRISEDEVFNQSSGKPVCKGYWQVIQMNPVYRRCIRPLFSPRARMWVQERLLPKAPSKLAPPSPDTVERIIEQVEPDAVELGRLLGETEPMWDFDKVREKFAAASSAT